MVIALAVVLLSGWHSTFRNALADLRFRWLQREATGNVVVVGIDARSIEAIGVWPWPRKLHAQLRLFGHRGMDEPDDFAHEGGQIQGSHYEPAFTGVSEKLPCQIGCALRGAHHLFGGGRHLEH